MVTDQQVRTTEAESCMEWEHQRQRRATGQRSGPFRIRQFRVLGWDDCCCAGTPVAADSVAGRALPGQVQRIAPAHIALRDWRALTSMLPDPLQYFEQKHGRGVRRRWTLRRASFDCHVLRLGGEPFGEPPSRIWWRCDGTDIAVRGGDCLERHPGSAPLGAAPEVVRSDNLGHKLKDSKGRLQSYKEILDHYGLKALPGPTRTVPRERSGGAGTPPT